MSIGLGLVLLLILPVTATSQPISPAGTDARHPAIAFTTARTVHVVWEQEGGIWHSYRETGTWTQPSEIIAEGEDPTLAASPTSEFVYLAWSQVFDGNLEVFASRWNGSDWSEGQNVSSNDGGSATPALAIAPNESVHLFWSDTSPGAATIYHAQSSDGLTWPTALPVPDAIGSNPSTVFSPDGNLQLAWQNRASFSDPFRIWTSRYNGSWHSPVVLTGGSQHAFAPQLAANASSTALTWQDGDQVRLATWQSNSWQPDSMFSGQQPALALTANGFTYWAWEQKDHLGSRYRYAGWSDSINWAESAQDSGDIAVANSGSQVDVVWAEQAAQGWQVYHKAIDLSNTYTSLILK